MSTKLLIYIGESVKFEQSQVEHAMGSMAGVSQIHRGPLIGSLLQCHYTLGDESTIIRLSEDLETITVNGIGPVSLGFAWSFQKAMPLDLRMIDMDYSFDVVLSEFDSVEELVQAISET